MSNCKGRSSAYPDMAIPILTQISPQHGSSCTDNNNAAVSPKEEPKRGSLRVGNHLAEVHEEQLRGEVLGGRGVHGGGQRGFLLGVALHRQIPHR